MNIDKKNRAELKAYFVKNAIPTESNFAELIEAALNQKDDGIVKLPGDPLSIEASGDATSQKKAINFYEGFADEKPAWVLSLNPRSDLADPETAQAGFSISDSDGMSKLFVDKATGNVGLGTTAPGDGLEVARGVRILSGSNPIRFTSKWSGFADASSAEISNDTDNYKTLMIVGNKSADGSSRKVSVWDRLEIHGTLSVTGNATLTNSEIGNMGWGSDWVGFAHQGGKSDTDSYKYSYALLQKNDGKYTLLNKRSGDGYIGFRVNNSNKMVIDSEGNVGIGTDSPPNKLDIQAEARSGTHPSSRPLYVTGGMGYESNGIEFRHSNGTQGIGFGYNTIYATGSNANQDLNLKARGSGIVGVPSGISVGGNRSGHFNTDGAFYRHAGQVYITVDDNLYIRDSGSGRIAAHFQTDSGKSILANSVIGDMGHSGWAGFAHKDAKVGSDYKSSYAFLQHESGRYTLINKLSGTGHIGFRVDNSDKMIINSAGNVGIGTTSPTATLHVYRPGASSYVNNALKVQTQHGYMTFGAVNSEWFHMDTDRSKFYFHKPAHANGGFHTYSTRDEKKDIRYLSAKEEDSVLESLAQLRLAEFRYKDEELGDRAHIGVIAEEAPAAIVSGGGRSINLYDYMSYGMTAIKALCRRLERMEMRMSKLGLSDSHPTKG
jgi:hypothetical protein